MGKEPKIYTFGCRLNSYESEIIEQDLIKKGVENIAVYNSCAVTEEAKLTQALGLDRAEALGQSSPRV